MNNRRSYRRLRQVQAIPVTVLSAPDTPQLANKKLVCTSQDLSVGGMQFVVREALPVKACVELLVELPWVAETFRHVGRIVWVKELAPGQRYAVGVLFTDTPIRDLTAWRKQLSANGSPSGVKG